jgi:transposase-like protein
MRHQNFKKNRNWKFRNRRALVHDKLVASITRSRKLARRNLWQDPRRIQLEIRCLGHLLRVRWPEGVICIDSDCRSTKVSRFKRVTPGCPRIIFECQACRRQWRPTTGTMFDRSHLPLYKWFRAITLLNGSSDTSIKSLKAELNVPYKTAWFVAFKIRDQTKNKDLVQNLKSAASLLRPECKRAIKSW